MRDLAPAPATRVIVNCAGRTGSIIGIQSLVADRRTGGRARRGMPDWTAAGLPVETGPVRQAAPAIDRYRRPCERTDNKAKAMPAYLDWECGLVAGPGRHARPSRAVARVRP